MMIVVIAVAVAVVVLLVRWLGGPNHGTTLRSPPGKKPLDILKERLARGKVDKEGFEEQLKTLGDQATTSTVIALLKRGARPHPRDKT